ncbi:hypothetical protein HFO68_15740 [Rhizobium laguerreae]|uniref:Uncharacterized protein n=1 Tax=Rhizobium laguerreae TaxID=1076926 RepID=A0ABR6G3F3_9HYPH|nr:hypothetical protein [Rhizobium laguerreae]MBB3160411.1 hypothetical protein [Rhizobium laguerreae]MBN9981998.1 hypothetical protein [Rhizobium laguerreae]MBY3069285.1 hypothetical protein [Rhizobium laguerreae]MBY3089519.1 hypothetical protein [Rhizobium laguerreae]MBY3098667.1 hypothetical protein [Rhizobium laguerreae]
MTTARDGFTQRVKAGMDAISHLRTFLEAICQPTLNLMESLERVVSDALCSIRDVKAP